MGRRVCSHRVRASSRALALGMALVAVVSIRPAFSEPGDLFTVAAPAVTDQPAPAASIAFGDAAVATKTGALTYSYPVFVPPGRRVQPRLSLAYSSQASIYGTWAAGWSLEGIPIITEDTTNGRLWGSIYTPAAKVYASSMAGGRRLIAVNEPAQGPGTYRAQHDSQFVSYKKSDGSSYWWRAQSPDGMTYYFGHTDAHTSSCGALVNDGYAPLTRMEDEFGNRVDYMWQLGVDGECRIKAITWGQNGDNDAVSGYFAAIEFDYAATPKQCAGAYVGSQTSYRTGVKRVTGASQVDAIRIAAFPPITGSVTLTPIPASPEHTRTITLTYNTHPTQPDVCFAGSAAYRALIKIEQSAVGVDSPLVTLPAVEFKYGTASPLYQASAPASPPWGFALTQPTGNLGWGYRFHDNQWPTVESMMLDIDADGLIDRVDSEPAWTVDGRFFCRAHWYRNQGPAYGGSFEDAGYIRMPTLKWATPNGATGTAKYAGGLHPGANTTTGMYERCALNFQRTAYQNSQNYAPGPSGGFNCHPYPTPCPTDRNYCGGPQVPTPTYDDCRPGKYGTAQEDTIFAWRWFDINGDHRPDLVGSPVRGGLREYNLQQGNELTGSPLSEPPPEPAIFGSFPACPATTFSSSTTPSNDPYTMCNGMFPWFVYLNHGAGNFGQPRDLDPVICPAQPCPGPTVGEWGPLPDRIIYQPIPLESAAGDSSLTSQPIGEYQGTLDIDGDGYADAVRQTSTNTWSVYRNDGTGALLPASGTAPFSFATGSNFALFRTDVVPGSTPPRSIQGLVDVNGDGLVDHWSTATVGSSTAEIQWNDGAQFRLTDVINTSRPGTDALFPSSNGYSGFVCDGVRVDERRPLDADNDGRTDVVTQGSTWQTVAFNQGGQFAAPATFTEFSNSAGGLLRRIVARSDTAGTCSSQITSGATFMWEVRSDMLDLDGDGLEEAIDFGDSLNPAATMTVSSVAPVSRQPRLLIEIKNNRGATTSIAYGSMNSAAVEQHPELNGGMPTTQWVVQSMTTVDSFANTTTTSSYHYKSPVLNRDDLGRYAFRGFVEVETTHPSGARTVERFTYTPDLTGRLTTKLVKPASTDLPTPLANEVRSIDETTWEERTLFLGRLKTYHATVADHWTCKNGQDEQACRANTDTHTRTVTHLTALASTTGPDFGRALLWQPTTSRTRTSYSDQDQFEEGDRETSTTYELAADGLRYRLRPLVTTRQVKENGVARVFAKSAKVWDAEYRVVTSDEVWVDDVDSNRAIKHYSYDMATGNLTKRWKPEQWATNTFTEFTYDSRKLFIATEVNELGHRRDYTYEYGTGTKLMTEGPNQRTCTTGSGCPLDATHPLKEQHKIRVDGLGRTIETWDTVSDDGVLYELWQRSTTSYVDAVSGSNPTSVTNRVRLSKTSSVWTEDKTELDGHGRPTKKTSFVQGSAPADQVTVYRYRNDGTLEMVDVPDPTQNNASRVAYFYWFDSLGRPTKTRRPDGALENASGVKIAYDGLSTETEAVTHPDVGGGEPISTKTLQDAFGRVVEVRELRDGTDWALTSYEYGPDDNVSTIIDPDGVTTTLKHDFAGQRTEITRHGRTWTYTYDKNGNLESEIIPGSPNPPSTDINYTTTILYDDLDRPESKIIGQRALSAADQALFANDNETFEWDIGGNMIGHLRYWRSFAPGENTAAIVHSTRFNNQGQLITAIQNLEIADYPELERRFGHRYHLFGGVSETRFEDQLGGTNKTIATTHYDPRALPTHMVLKRTGQPDEIQAVQTRNVAGLVTKRRTDTTGTMTYVESNWTYDELGRVHSQSVEKGPGPVEIVRQVLEYTGHDNPKTLFHYLGNAEKEFHFTYDSRHQLKTVSTATPGYFDAGYNYGEGGRFTRATVSQTIAPLPAGTEVKPRDVNYVYGDPDPERLTALTNVSDGTTYAGYSYDDAGNMTQRCFGGNNGATTCAGEATEYVYDGKNQLRRAVKKLNGVIQGSEEYWYSGDGQRIAVVKRDSAGNKTELIWFIGDVQAHYDGAGNITRVYSHLSLGTPVARIERTSNTATSVEYQFHGLANNTIAAVAQDGTTNASFSYAPFGEVIEATDGGAPSAGVAAHRRRMNDKFVDDVSGLAYYGFRYYDITSMTWTQADPLFSFLPDLTILKGTPRESQRYTFSLNNPLRYIDPDGRYSTQVSVWSPPASSDGSPFPQGPKPCDGVTGLCEQPDEERPQNPFEPPIVTDLKDAVSAERYVEAAASAADAAAPLVKEAVELGKDMTPFLGTARMWERGEYFGAVISAIGDAMLVGGLIGKIAGAGGSRAISIAIKGCFVAGTAVVTPNGSLPIEQLKVGDSVVSRDEATGEYSAGEIVEVFVRPDAPIVELLVSDASGHTDLLETTTEHPFWVQDRGWTTVGELNAGNVLLGIGGLTLTVAAIRTTDHVTTVYNIEVAGAHTYFVGQLGAFVHNKPATRAIPKFTRQMLSRAEIIETGRGIRKVDTLVKEFGGTAKKWKKMKTWTDAGEEIHYYEHHGIGRVGEKWAGTPDPF